MPENLNDENQERLAIVRRDAGAFADWLARCEEPLRLSLRSYARQVDVEAIVQETALRVWQAAFRIQPDGRPRFLLRWAITVARNLARDAVRRQGREVPLDPETDLPAPPPDAPSDPGLKERINLCFKRLSPRLRRAVETRRKSGGTLGDRRLAEIAGMSFDAFRQNLTRARRLLEACLERHGVDLRSHLR